MTTKKEIEAALNSIPDEDQIMNAITPALDAWTTPLLKAEEVLDWTPEDATEAEKTAECSRLRGAAKAGQARYIEALERLLAAAKS